MRRVADSSDHVAEAILEPARRLVVREELRRLRDRAARLGAVGRLVPGGVGVRLAEVVEALEAQHDVQAIGLRQIENVIEPPRGSLVEVLQSVVMLEREGAPAGAEPEPTVRLPRRRHGRVVVVVVVGDAHGVGPADVVPEGEVRRAVIEDEVPPVRVVDPDEPAAQSRCHLEGRAGRLGVAQGVDTHVYLGAVLPGLGRREAYAPLRDARGRQDLGVALARPLEALVPESGHGELGS